MNGAGEDLNEKFGGIFFAFALGALIFLLNQNMVMRGIERKML